MNFRTQQVEKWLVIAGIFFGLTFGGLVSGSAMAEEGKKEPGKISGYMFGDYYFASRHHDETIEGMNGFWFRRIYFTYDQKLENGFAIRFRLEMNSPGDFTTSDTLKPYVKDAYLQHSRGLRSISFGLIPTPTWESVEGILGYRPVEKTPLDLYKMGESRDTGVSIRGYLDGRKRTAYWVMLGNGSGTKAETDKGKTVYTSLSRWLTPELYVEGYADLWNKPQNQDWRTLQGFLVYKKKAFRGGLLYAVQTRKRPPPDRDLELSVLSFYADYQTSEKVKPFFRMDRVSDPVPGANNIAYLSVSPDAQPAFYLLGLDYALAPDVHLIPNLEMVRYDKPVSGPTPKNDLFYRLTFYYAYK